MLDADNNTKTLKGNTSKAIRLIWRNMHNRCYRTERRAFSLGYMDCSVALDWHTFENFEQWVLTQDWRGKQLDKDLRVPGNKIYGPEFCMFVSRQVNMLTTRGSSVTLLPQGVSRNSGALTFRAQITVYGVVRHLGSFRTASEAESAYREAKKLHIIEVSDAQEPEVREVIRNYVDVVYP